MTSAATSVGPVKKKTTIVLLIIVGLAVLAAANAHLLYVAVTSQPECVTHVRRGEGNGAGNLSAAVSSCSPKTAKSAKAE